MMMYFRLALLLVISAALSNGSAMLNSAPEEGSPTARAALLVWLQEHAGEFDNFAKRGKPVDIDTEGPCLECAWFCVRESSPIEVLYGVGLTLDAPPTSCREGEAVRVFRQGDEWKADPSRALISLGKPSWQEIVAQVKQGFPRPTDIGTTILVEREDLVVIKLILAADTSWSGHRDRYRVSKGADGLWRGYVSVDPAYNQYGTPEDLFIDFAIEKFSSLAIAGDCSRVREDHDRNTLCWQLTWDTGDRRSYQIGPSFGVKETVEIGRTWLRGWVRIPTVDPAAHAAFLAWAKEYGYERVEPAGIKPDAYSWSVQDSSAREYLYVLTYPVEGGRSVRVFRQGTEWKAEEVPH